MKNNKYAKPLVILALLFALLTPASAAIEHHWSNAAKEAVGTAYGQNSSLVWFTVGRGIINEVYYPRVDRVQVGDSQLLFVTASGTFLEEKRDFTYEVTHPNGVPRATIHARHGKGATRIEFTKDVLTDTELPVVRVRYRFAALPSNTRVYILHKPTAANDGASDLGRVVKNHNGTAPVALLAWDSEVPKPTYQAILSSAAMARASVGEVGETDGWQDLNRHGKMVNEIQANGPTNLALTAELIPSEEIEVAISFGDSAEEAIEAGTKSLGKAFSETRRQFDRGWGSYLDQLETAPWLHRLPKDVRDDVLWNAAIVKTHEDKQNPGAIIASLSIPHLPDSSGMPDGKNTGGYHLIWVRDLFKSALAMLRLGDTQTVLNILNYMSRMERDGRMMQNTWVDGRPFWTGEQMDQEAYPVLLAALLERQGTKVPDDLHAFLDRRVTKIKHTSGRTGQERWEEVSGYSPNTLAVIAGALASIGDNQNAKRILEAALQKTVSRRGSLAEKPYFIRVSQLGEPDGGHYLQIANGGPNLREDSILDGGFLEWLRWFPNPSQNFGPVGAELEQIVNNTLSLYDDPRFGVASSLNGIPLYLRYNSDAYGMRNRGGPWPILTAERAIPLLARAESRERRRAIALTYVQHVRDLWNASDLCPEQILATSETKKATTATPMPHAATPLMWCHAEMIELAYQAELQ